MKLVREAVAPTAPTGGEVTHTHTHTSPAQPASDRRCSPPWLVAGASIATGLLVSIVLTLVVFAGAGEHVISGAALLAYAGGWAALALFTGRHSNRRQRWACVPAALMGAAGLGLVVVRPDDAALNAAGWVWPPVIVALAVWVFGRVRSGFDGKVRWLFSPVLAALVLGAVGGMYETTARLQDRQTYPPPGILYDVGGRRLHLHCTGTGGPTVVLMSGLGGISAGWARVTADVNRTTRVCAYDRAGQGWSDDVDTPQDGLAIAADLHTLLAQAHESGPYVLVGHSAGGPYAMIFAAQYPDRVAGMVLLDPMSPYEFSELDGFASEQSMLRRGLGILPSLARLGIGRALPASVWSSLPEPSASQVRAFAASARGMRNLRDEQSMYPVILEQAKALTSLEEKPLVVVTATGSLQKHEEWFELQADLAALSPTGDHRLADATHAALIDDEAGHAPSAHAIVDVIDSIRTMPAAITGS